MRKIAVSGCANCPYLTVHYNNSRLDNQIVFGSCKHPSFNNHLPEMRIGPTKFIEYEATTIDDDYSGEEPTGYGSPDTTPKWCPLPFDNETDK